MQDTFASDRTPGLSDRERAIVGEKLAKALHLIPNKNGLYPTDRGEKTSLGLFQSINGMLFEFADEVARETEAEKRLDNVIYIYK